MNLHPTCTGRIATPSKDRPARRTWLKMRRTGMSVCVAIGTLVAAPAALANESLTSTNIFLDIRTDNAAIDTLTSFGFDNFNPGTPVSDWGLMLDGSPSTFQLNTTSGGGIAFGTLTNSGGVISGTATYTSGAYALTLTREYQLVGPNSLMVTTVVQNTGQAIGSFLGFDTFDPDIGIPRSGGFPTYNDVFTSGGILIGLASDDVTSRYSVALGVTDPRAVVAAGSPFQINSAALLTSVASAPFDGNGTLADQGLHVVFSTPLAAGASTTFQYFLNFGTSPTDAITALESTMGGFCPTDNLNNTCLVTSTTDQNVMIDAQGGTDTLQLGGTTNFDFSVARIDTRYTNFEVFQKVDTSTVTLTGTTSRTSLGFDVLAGTLVAGTGQLGSAGAVTVSAPGTLQIASSSTIGSLAGSGNVDLGADLATGGNDTSTEFSGVLLGAGDLSKDGTGTLTLSGTNTYTGKTFINVGAIRIENGAALGSTAGETVVASGAALEVQGSIVTGAEAVTLNGTGIADGGALRNISGNNILGGPVTLASATRINSDAGTIQTNGAITGAGQNLTVGGSGDVIVNAGLNTGTGTLTKDGSGILALNSVNSFTGLTTLNAGTLQLSYFDGPVNGAISDTSAILINGGLLAVATNETIGSLTGSAGSVYLYATLTSGGDNTSGSFAGQLDGTGKLVKDGTGLLSLSGNNTFSGGIDIIHGGIRLLGNSAAGTGPITTFGSVISYGNAVNNAAPIILSSNTTQLEVLAADAATQSGAISETGGSRPIEKIGTGTLTLSGANTYTGPTTITAGTLDVSGGSALSNSAGVQIAGAGTLSISSNESIGSLTGSGGLNLGTGSILTTGLDNTSGTFSGNSAGAGGLTKSGSGTFTFSGSNAFSGPMTVASGNLTVLGALSGTSALNIAGGANAFFGGTVQGVDGSGMAGTSLGSISASTGGTVYLDDNTSLSGTSASFASGSNLNLFLTTNTSQYGKINLTGLANISGANVGVYLDPISFAGTSSTTFTYSNVITGSSVSGTFGSVNLLQSPSALFSVTGIYSPTSAGVTVIRNPFTNIGGDGDNQGNVGDGLEIIFVNGTNDPDLQNLFNVIGLTPPGGVPGLYTLVAGAENSENSGAGLRTDDPWKQSVAERVNAARTTGCTVSGETWCLRRYAQATTNGSEVMSDVQGDPTAFDWLETGIRDAGSTSFWARVIGAWGETKGDINGPGSQQLTGGMIGGVDRVFDSLLLAGVAAQYVESSVDYDASPNKGLIRSGQFGAYVSYGGAEAYVNGNVSMIGTQASANRYMTIGLLNYNVESFARSWALTASVEAGKIIEFDGLRFEPSLALNYQGAHPVDFEEHGGGGLSLLVRPDDSNSLRSILSARLSRVFDLGDRKIVPQLRLDWRHEMLDRGQGFSAAFAGDPTVFFDVKGAAYARDVFSTGASITMPLTGRITGYVDAQGAFSEDSTSAMISLGGRATW
ncbi:MAG: autotransporter domain-containing protein [Micropepsaceae bacterium]